MIPMSVIQEDYYRDHSDVKTLSIDFQKYF
jgi:hypothetical protein